jgi:hypothetical protein
VKAQYKENRRFPRMPVKCPVVYRRGETQRGRVGIMIDMSATGIKMTCKEPLALDTTIQLEVKPGSDRSIPAIVGEGVVVRCEATADDEYHIACRLTRVNLPGNRKK